jgi:Iron-containing redox enzyme
MSGSIRLASGARERHHIYDGPALQRRLAHWNRRRLAPQTPTEAWRDVLEADHDMRLLEGAFLEETRKRHSERALTAPSDPAGFVEWFEALEHKGPGQGDALFPWLAKSADLEEMRWFLTQEVAGEAGFDDLVALAQIKAPTQAKLELARNYWDEMGRGNPKGMHGPMLDKLAKALAIEPHIETTVTPSLALGNTMIGLATNRRYFYHALGALGVIEQTAPGRAQQVAEGLKRLGVASGARHYFVLHAVLDVKHSAAWNKEVFAPLVAEKPECARFLAEGALMRLGWGEASFEAYRKHLWGGNGTAAPA